jgi:hypothetical protein
VVYGLNKLSQELISIDRMLSIDPGSKVSLEMPSIFSEGLKRDLIERAFHGTLKSGYDYCIR